MQPSTWHSPKPDGERPLRHTSPAPVIAAEPPVTAAAPAGLRLLIVEDRPRDADLAVATLEAAGYTCEWQRVDTREAFLDRLKDSDFDLILADFTMPSFDGLTALRLLQEQHVDIPFIFVSGTLGEERAIECLKAGATDYVLKTRLTRLIPVVARALREAREQRRRREAETARQEEANIATALAHVGRELISSLDTPVLLKQLCQLTADLLDCDVSRTLLWQPNEGVFAVAAEYGANAEQSETLCHAPIAEPLIAPLLARLEREDVVEVTTGNAEQLVSAALLTSHQVVIGLFSALRRGPAIIGLQTAGRSRPFDGREHRILEGIARLGSLALSNAHVVEELERVSRMKSDFVSVMSHELRTPLNIIMGYTDLLLEEVLGPLTGKQQNALQTSRKRAAELNQLISSILDLGQLDREQLKLDLQETSVAELVRDIEAGAQPLLAEKPQLRWRADVPAPIPALRTDLAKLKVVLRNLVANAIKFTEAGAVTVSFREDRGGVEIAVADTGIGIAPATMPMLFEPFRQAEGALTRRYGGVGMGLHVVRRLLEVLRGRVSVESELGRGSTFRVWLPLDCGAPAGMSPDGASERGA